MASKEIVAVGDREEKGGVDDVKDEPQTQVQEKPQEWDRKLHWDLDEGDEFVRYRRKW
jgi:hypothetical protein